MKRTNYWVSSARLTSESLWGNSLFVSVQGLHDATNGSAVHCTPWLPPAVQLILNHRPTNSARAPLPIVIGQARSLCAP